MSIAEDLLPEFDHEMGSTRRTLERVDESQLAWTPHERSMTLGRLASHIAELPGWAASTLNDEFFDFAAPGGYTPHNLASRQEILDLFATCRADARAALVATPDAKLFEPWSLKRGGETIFTQPRIVVLRSWLFSHIIHHRGQLTVYLRMTGSPVPSIYGPSADEKGM